MIFSLGSLKPIVFSMIFGLGGFKTIVSSMIFGLGGFKTIVFEWFSASKASKPLLFQWFSASEASKPLFFQWFEPRRLQNHYLFDDFQPRRLQIIVFSILFNESGPCRTGVWPRASRFAHEGLSNRNKTHISFVFISYCFCKAGMLPLSIFLIVFYCFLSRKHKRKIIGKTSDIVLKMFLLSRTCYRRRTKTSIFAK